MALTRKFLSALGIEADKVDEIINAHSETVDALKEQRDSFKTDAEKLSVVQKELDDLKAQIADDDSDEWKDKYEKLKTEYDNYKADITSKETMTAKKTALEELAKDILSDSGVAKAIKYANWDSYELDEDGKLLDAKKHMEDLREEWSDYVLTEDKRGADTPTPPTNDGGTVATREEIMKIADTQERQRAWAEYLQKGDE